MTEKQVAPDEVAQIVFNGANQATLILRYKTEKKAAKHFADILKARKGGRKEDNSHLLMLDSDMFSTLVDPTEFSNISLLVHRVRRKFEPYRD